MQTKTKFIIGFLVLVVVGSAYYFSDGALFTGKLDRRLAPDLTIPSLSIMPQPVIHGYDATVSVVVKNLSTTPSGFTNVSYTLEGASTASFIPSSLVSNFRGAGRQVVTATFVPERNTPQTLTACVDQRNLIIERNENNNCASVTFNVMSEFIDGFGSTPRLVLSLAPNPTLGSTQHVQGQSDVKFVGISAFCDSDSDCILKDMTLTCDIDEEGDANDFYPGYDNAVYFNSITSSIWLEDSAGDVAAAQPVQSSGLVSFTGINHTIGAGDTSVIYVVGDISRNAFATGNSEDLSCGVNATTDVVWEDSSGVSRNSANTVNARNEVWVKTIYGGSLTISVSPNTSAGGVAVAGSTLDVAKFKFETTAEPFLVEELSINAQQSGVANINLGDNDNNISAVRISYINSLGVLESKTGYLTDGTAQFSGMDFYIARDTAAELTVAAVVNSATAGATSGEFINLNLAFNNFEAVALTSGNTHRTDWISEFRPISADGRPPFTWISGFGPVTWASGYGLFELERYQNFPLLRRGDIITLMVDDGFHYDNTNRLPVGTLICVDDNNDRECDMSSVIEDIYVVMSWPSVASNDADSVTVKSIGWGVFDHNYDGGDELLYALPGLGYLTETNSFEVL